MAAATDIAHSLADSFDLGRGLHEKERGPPVAPNLDAQDLAVQEELERHWGEIHKYFASVFATTGSDGIAAQELAILLGME